MATSVQQGENASDLVEDQDSEQTTFLLLDLPDEIVIKILRHISSDNASELLRSVPLVCKRLNVLCHDPSVWMDVGVAFRLPCSELRRMGERVFVGSNSIIRRWREKRVQKLKEKLAYGTRTEFGRVGQRLHQGTRFLRVTTSCDCGGKGMCRANREIDVEDLISDFLLSRCPGLHGLALKGPDPKRRMIRSLPSGLRRLSRRSDRDSKKVKLREVDIFLSPRPRGYVRWSNDCDWGEWDSYEMKRFSEFLEAIENFIYAPKLALMALGREELCPFPLSGARLTVAGFPWKAAREPLKEEGFEEVEEEKEGEGYAVVNFVDDFEGLCGPERFGKKVTDDGVDYPVRDKLRDMIDEFYGGKFCLNL